MKVLLTGATGFVGRNLLLDLLADPTIERVAVCVRHGGKMLALLAEDGYCGLPEKLEIVQGSDRDWGLARLTFAPEVAVHSAGVLFAHRPQAYYDCNVEGTQRLLAALPATCRTVVLSSQSAAGPTPSAQAVRVETDPAAPLSDYGKSKQQMEEMLGREFAGQREIVILRPPMVLGPRDAATVPLFRMASGPVWVKPGGRTKHLSWIGVSDLVRAIRLVLKGRELSTGKIPTYFVCSQPEITDCELIETTARVMGRRGLLLPLPDAMLRLVGAVSAWVPAIGRAVPSLQPDRLRELLEWKWVVSDAVFRRDYGWESQAKLPEVLRETAEWLQHQGVLEKQGHAS